MCLYIQVFILLYSGQKNLNLGFLCIKKVLELFSSGYFLISFFSTVWVVPTYFNSYLWIDKRNILECPVFNWSIFSLPHWRMIQLYFRNSEKNKMLTSVFLGIQDTTCKQNLSLHWLPINVKINLLPLPLNLVVRHLNNDKKLKRPLWLKQLP